MTWVIWSPRAELELEAYLDWIAERDPEAAIRIRNEIVAWTEGLANHPTTGNPGRWPGFRTHGKPKRHKMVIYQVMDDHIEIAAFRDMRQDNTKLKLRAKRTRD